MECSQFNKLTQSIDSGNLTTLKWYLESGGDPNIYDESSKETLVNYVAKKHSEEYPFGDDDEGPSATMLLLDYGGDPDFYPEGGSPPLITASMKGLYKLVDTLLQYGANPDIQYIDQYGITPLLGAIISLREQRLLKDKAKQTMMDRNKDVDFLKVVKILLKWEANTNIQATFFSNRGKEVINVCNAGMGQTNDVDTIILEHVNNKENDLFGNLIISILSPPHTYLYEYLQGGGDPNLSANANARTVTLLTSAISHSEHDAVRILLDNGADPNYQSIGSKTPLAWASHYGDHRLVSLLLSHRADPNIQQTLTTTDGDTYLLFTPLTHAAEKLSINTQFNDVVNHSKVIDLLLDAGANTDIQEFSLEENRFVTFFTNPEINNEVKDYVKEIIETKKQEKILTLMRGSRCPQSNMNHMREEMVFSYIPQMLSMLPYNAEVTRRQFLEDNENEHIKNYLNTLQQSGGKKKRKKKKNKKKDKKTRCKKR